MMEQRCCSKLRFATFNCGQSGVGGTDPLNPNGFRTCELMDALERIKFDIVVLSETHGKEERHSKWKHGGLRGSELHIGAADGLVGGIGFIVNARLSSKIHSVDVSSSRVGVLKLKLGRRQLLTVIQCYAPHSGYDDHIVEAFYAEVEQHLAAIRGPVVVMGDFNARVGPNEPDELYIGRHSAEHRNEAGIRLAAFAEAQKLYVANSLFQKPLSKRWTWQSSDLVTKSELDYVLYGDRKSIENLEVLSQFHARSDHRLVRATIRVDMKKIRKQAFFKRPCRPTELDKIKFQKLVTEADWNGPSGGRMMEQYERFQETLTQCATDASLRKESTRHTWKTPETTDLLTQLRQAKSRGDSEEAKRLSKLCRKKVAEDYETYRNSRLVQTAEKRRSLKKCRRDMAQSQLITGALVDENGELQTERDTVEEICRSFYTKLFESKVDVPRHRRAEASPESEVPSITVDEVEAALCTMKNGKAPGPDGVKSEMLKAGGPTLWKQLARMFTQCLRKKKIPPQWKESTTVLLYKKGDAKNLKNYRPICLLSVVYKLFTKVLTRRITDDLDRAQPVEQAGFRQGYGTLDHLQTVNQIQEKAREKGLRQYLVFVDYEKAFDTVETSAVLNALEAQGVRRRYIDILEDIYEDSETLITLFDKPIRIPIRRGLFTAALEIIFRELRWDERRNTGITIDGRRLTHLRFADDIVLIGSNLADVQRRLVELNEKSNAVGLRINKDKTEWFEYFRTSERIHLEGEEIRRAKSYVYLGQQLSEDHSANMNGEIGRRQKAAWLSFKNIQEVLKKISDPKLRANLFNTTVLPALLYGCETWTLTKRQEEKLSVTERAMERRVLGLTMWDQERNEAVREKTGFADAVKEAHTRKLRWAGHRRTKRRRTVDKGRYLLEAEEESSEKLGNANALGQIRTRRNRRRLDERSTRPRRISQSYSACDNRVAPASCKRLTTGIQSIQSKAVFGRSWNTVF